MRNKVKMVECKIVDKIEEKGNLKLKIDYLGKIKQVTMSEKSVMYVLSRSSVKSLEIGCLVNVIRQMKPSYSDASRFVELFQITKVIR